MSNDELQALVAQTIQIVNSNSRAIEANSTAIAELRENSRRSFEDTMVAIAAVAQVAQTASESVTRLEQVVETWIRHNNNGNGSEQ